MSSSLKIFVVFVVGVVLGRWGQLPEWIRETDYSVFILVLLMFLVGMSLGLDKEALRKVFKQNRRIFFLPLATIFGTLLGVMVAGLLLPRWSMTDCLAVGSGFGYYSLSSVLITQVRGAELGTIALMANITREMIALLFAPFFVRFFGPYSPISVGGATTMDTTLPIITQTSGKDFVIPSIVHGFFVDLSVPFLVTFFLAF